jgi:hypothetical protein
VDLAVAGVLDAARHEQQQQQGRSSDAASEGEVWLESAMLLLQLHKVGSWGCWGPVMCDDVTAGWCA